MLSQAAIEKLDSKQLDIMDPRLATWCNDSGWGLFMTLFGYLDGSVMIEASESRYLCQRMNDRTNEAVDSIS